MKHFVKLAAVAAFLFPLISLAAAGVKRDIKHAENVERYRASLTSAKEFNLTSQCTTQVAKNSWKKLDFEDSMQIAKLPNGQNAAAFCITVPSGARVLTVQSPATGGLTYWDYTVVHPSFQFLDSNHQLIKDLEVPRLTARDGVFKGFGLSGNIVLTGPLANTRYVVVYVHTLSLDGAVNAYIPGNTISVPYNPYGRVKIKFE